MDRCTHFFRPLFLCLERHSSKTFQSVGFHDNLMFEVDDLAVASPDTVINAA
jgi:hypothetical protein